MNTQDIRETHKAIKKFRDSINIDDSIMVEIDGVITVMKLKGIKSQHEFDCKYEEYAEKVQGL